MNGKPVALMITWWVETIVSVRVLLFSIPVLISQCSSESFSLNDLNDRFIAVMTATAVLFFLAGIVSILGVRMWKAVHILALIGVLAVTFGLPATAAEAAPSAGANYFAPALLAAVFTVLSFILGKKA